VVVPVIREPEKMTVVKRVAGVHSIYPIARAGSPDKARQAPPPGKQRAMPPPLFPGSRCA
ncbi:hypothetical protein DDJ34_28215, partial [Klebsiella oxytoca]